MHIDIDVEIEESNNDAGTIFSTLCLFNLSLI
jgi:hypothetical protein